MVPCDGGSSAPSMYSSELFPLPEGPVMAAASPGDNVKLTSDNTVSGPRGVGYCLLTSETFNTVDLRARDGLRLRTPRVAGSPMRQSYSECGRRRRRDLRVAWTVRDPPTAGAV